MYERHFGLTARPFSKTPDPAFFFDGAGHGEALARLELAVADRELCLFTGEIGAGKTTVSRALVDRLDDSHRVVLVVNPRLSAAQLIEFIAVRVGVERLPQSRVKRFDALTARLFALHEAGLTTVLLIDEAHLLPNKGVFEELRLLLNLQLDDAALLALLLVGQPELRTRLGQRANAAFAERIGLAYHLRAFERAETGAYVAHRLERAGRAEQLFTEGALDIVHAASGGIPRRIHTLCQGALLEGYGRAVDAIDASVVEDVVRDLSLHLGPAFFAAESRSVARRGAP